MRDKTLQDVVAGELRRLGCGPEVTAAVENGVVTLTGEAEEAQRRIVEQELLRLPGVADVRNQLRLRPPSGDLRTQLLSLLEREGVSAAGLLVEVGDGRVWLSGRAESWFDRDAAERLAWSLPGVRAVTNRIGLPPGAADPETGEEAPLS